MDTDPDYLFRYILAPVFARKLRFSNTQMTKIHSKSSLVHLLNVPQDVLENRSIPG